MFDLGQLSSFHFLRPLWLLTMIPVLLLWVLLLRRQSAARQWKKFIASHLLQHLMVGKTQKKRVRPVNLLLPVFILAALALAGPTWLQEPLPFSEDEAPLIIALDLSFEMNTVDIQPSRLERAKQKVRDLLAERAGARTALIGYAGSAHMILPLTDDPQILELYLDSLSPELMPAQGKNTAAALALAEELLAREQAPGTILFMTNSIEGESRADITTHQEASENAVMVLGFGTAQGGPIPTGGNRFLTDREGNRVISTLDREGLTALSQDVGVYVTSVTIDNSDVRRINGRVKRHLTDLLTEDENTRWKDYGYFLIFPVALLALFWYRKGWTIQWLSGFILAVLLFQPAPAEAQTKGFLNLWLTADQQGRYHFEKGRYTEAALCFEDPLWKGVAFYFAQDYEAAIQQFSRVETAEGYFNLGNAYAHLGDYDQAKSSYDQALDLEPDFIEAEQNRKQIQAILDKQAAEKEKEQRGGEPGAQLDPDEIRMADPSDPTKRPETEGDPIEIKQEMYSDEQLNEMWMRRVQISPADFLRMKFAYQRQARERDDSAEETPGKKNPVKKDEENPKR
jgi:Ca-activated chloride channel family protein